MDTFRKLCNIGLLRCKCGWEYVKKVHSRLHHYDANEQCGTLTLKQGEVSQAARSIADILFGGLWRYDILRGWLYDDDSRSLLEREILQRALFYAEFHMLDAKNVAAAINTGISHEEWDILCVCEGNHKKEYMKDFAGSKYLSDKENEEIITGARVTEYILNQYEYKDICTLHEGDTFLDCGACFGDTAVWAMDKVGDSGTVVSFEPIENQVEVLKENVKRHSAVRKTRVLVENAAVSDGNGYLLFDECWGGSPVGSSREAKDGKVRVSKVKIDDYCREHNIRPDYIKMDIEGAELSALSGAQETIQKLKPRLAICVYHKLIDDFMEIPSFIKSIVPSYKFYLKKSHYVNETVLFAVPMD